jgi:hypothetical protein
MFGTHAMHYNELQKTPKHSYQMPILKLNDHIKYLITQVKHQKSQSLCILQQKKKKKKPTL